MRGLDHTNFQDIRGFRLPLVKINTKYHTQDRRDEAVHIGWRLGESSAVYHIYRVSLRPFTPNFLPLMVR